MFSFYIPSTTSIRSIPILFLCITLYNFFGVPRDDLDKYGNDLLLFEYFLSLLSYSISNVFQFFYALFLSMVSYYITFLFSLNGDTDLDFLFAVFILELLQGVFTPDVAFVLILES